MTLDERVTRVPGIAALWLLLVLGLMPRPAQGDEFRLSFLDEAPALEDTCRVLRQAGVSEPTVSTFRKLVTCHNQLGRHVNNHDSPSYGVAFTRFGILSDLVRRLPEPFSRMTAGATPGTPHVDVFRCCRPSVARGGLWDAAAGAGIQIERYRPAGARRTDQGSGLYEAFRAGYLLALCPEADYLRLLGRPRSAEETELELSLVAPHGLGGGRNGVRKSSIREALEESRRAMERFGFGYGGKAEIGFSRTLADFERRALSADHAFVCVPHKGGLICVEKTSPTGLVVCADFKSAEDLGRYEAMAYVDYPFTARQTGYGCPNLAVALFDNRTIQIFQPAARLDAAPPHSIPGAAWWSPKIALALGKEVRQCTLNRRII